MKTKQLPKIGSGGLRDLMQGLLSFSTKKVKFARDTTHSLATGLYLVTGAGGAGKSVVARALAGEAITSGWEDVGVLPIFEPNSPSYGASEFVNDAKFMNETGQSAAGPADIFSGDVGRLLTSWQAQRGEGSAQALLTIDSLARPMRAYLIEARKAQPAAPGSFQSADLAFAQRLNDTAVHLNLTVLGVVSDELVPFAHILDGVVQGMISAQSFSRFKIQDRPSGRQLVSHVLSLESCKLAFLSLGYDIAGFDEVYRADSAGASTSSGPVLPHFVVRGESGSQFITQ